MFETKTRDKEVSIKVMDTAVVFISDGLEIKASVGMLLDFNNILETNTYLLGYNNKLVYEKFLNRVSIINESNERITMSLDRLLEIKKELKSLFKYEEEITDKEYIETLERYIKYLVPPTVLNKSTDNRYAITKFIKSQIG